MNPAYAQFAKCSVISQRQATPPPAVDNSRADRVPSAHRRPSRKSFSSDVRKAALAIEAANQQSQRKVLSASDTRKISNGHRNRRSSLRDKMRDQQYLADKIERQQLWVQAQDMNQKLTVEEARVGLQLYLDESISYRKRFVGNNRVKFHDGPDGLGNVVPRTPEWFATVGKEIKEGLDGVRLGFHQMSTPNRILAENQRAHLVKECVHKLGLFTMSVFRQLEGPFRT